MSTSTLPGSNSQPSLGTGEWIRTFLLLQSATFVLASMIHFGALLAGFADIRAAVPEGVIAAVLLGGLLATWIRPRRIRSFAIGVQGFALAGTFVGLFVIAIGIGPSTMLDLATHSTMLAELVGGLIVAVRARATAGMPA